MTRKPLLAVWFVLICGGLLTACTTMTPNECRTADWGAVGLRDGLAGESRGQLDARVKDCAEVGVQVGTLQYLQGRDQGLQSYCQMPNAARFGLDGKAYRGVCPVQIDAEFRRRHALGKAVHDAREELRGQERRRDAQEKRIDKAANDDERRKAREGLRDIDRDIRRAEIRLREADWALDSLR
jgi:Protein of unknown function (DUF2799)